MPKEKQARRKGEEERGRRKRERGRGGGKEAENDERMGFMTIIYKKKEILLIWGHIMMMIFIIV